MTFIKMCLMLVLFILSCSSSEALNDEKNNFKKDASTKATRNSDDELMGLLGDNEAGTGRTNASQKDTVAEDYENPESKSDSEVTELQNEIQALKQSLNQKVVDMNNLVDENTQLKNSKSTQGAYQQFTEEISESEYEEKYNEAFQLFESRQYDMAISQFENLIANDDSNSLSDNAQYWIGECHFAQRKYKQSILDFEKVFTFKKSNKFEDAQFKIAYCYFLIKDKDSARVELNRFINQYPEGRNVDRAKELLSSL